jgi:hypothetical protein
MNRGTYVLRNAGVTISTAITILQLKAGTNYPLEILRASLSQFGSTTSAGARFSLLRKTGAATVTAASAGTHLNKMNSANPTSDVSLGTTATGYTGTSEGTDGDILVDEGFNVINGFVWLPTPEERIVVPVSGFLAMKFLTAPASHTWYASIYFRELS